MATASREGNGGTTLDWVDIIKSLYPEALSTTYIVPPVHFNRQQFQRVTVPGSGLPALRPCLPGKAHHEVPVVDLKPQPESQYSLWTEEQDPTAQPVTRQASDYQADFAQRHVLANLEKLGRSRGEVMFVLSDLNFDNILSKRAYAEESARLPRPANISGAPKNGDFDVLVIHRQHGILLGEMKSVGFGKGRVFDGDVNKEIKKAVKQLEKCEKHVKHLVSEIGPGLTVRKTLILPYVTSEQLLRILTNATHLASGVFKILGVTNAEEAVQLCCCSDQLSEPTSHEDVTPDVLSKLTAWWERRLACSVDPLLTDQLYLDVVARIIGPATSVLVHCNTPPRVEVLTEGDAVSELGRRLALLILTLQQLDLLQMAPPRLCITGPPGTGKTVMLVLQGLRWLLEGHDVHVISGDFACAAVNIMIATQLKNTLRAYPPSSTRPGSIVYHAYWLFRDDIVDTAVRELTAASKGGVLHVLMDEAVFNSSPEPTRHYRRLVSELTARIPQLLFWAACVGGDGVPPELQKEALTVPLRFAPSIVNQVKQGIDLHDASVQRYTDGGFPAPGDGLKVVRLVHHGNKHLSDWPVDCFNCGVKIAAKLHRLGVGTAGSEMQNSPRPLSCNDVLILTRSSELHNGVKDDAGNVTSRASEVVQGLRSGGFTTCVVEEGALTLASGLAESNMEGIVISHFANVKGLERKVVVWLPGRLSHGRDDARSEVVIKAQDRMLIASRCTTHLIKVCVHDFIDAIPSKAAYEEKLYLCLSDFEERNESDYDSDDNMFKVCSREEEAYESPYDCDDMFEMSDGGKTADVEHERDFKEAHGGLCDRNDIFEISDGENADDETEEEDDREDSPDFHHSHDHSTGIDDLVETFSDGLNLKRRSIDSLDSADAGIPTKKKSNDKANEINTPTKSPDDNEMSDNRDNNTDTAGCQDRSKKSETILDEAQRETTVANLVCLGVRKDFCCKGGKGNQTRRQSYPCIPRQYW